jgi:Predicted membrane protein (DUF2142)
LSRSVRIPLLLFVGALFVQAAWILTLPPFRGTDEFDHAYRAAAVAGGQWRSPGVAATHGRGQLVIVPRDLVDAAHPVCASYTYTGHDNCNPVSDMGRGRVQVASAAASYNPLFYWVIGTPARPFHGAASLYAMRIVAALLCAVLLALAGWATSLWSRTRWPLVAMVAAATPVMLFSLSVAAPNGLEMCAAMTVWAALLGLHRRAPGEAAVPALLGSATVGALVLVTLRSIGPVWLALIVATVAVSLGTRRLAELLRCNAAVAATCSGLVLLGTLAAVAWTRIAATNALEAHPTETANRLTAALGQLPLWVLQGIAAFPRRTNAAPPIVYPLVGLALAALVIAGYAAAGGRLRVAMLLTVGVSVAVPLVLTIATIRETGAVWQGRYGLPYFIGLPLMAGLSLDRAGPRHGVVAPALCAGWLALATADVVSVLHVLGGEERTSPLAGSSQWLRAPAPVVAVLVVVGLAAWAMACRGPRSEPSGRRTSASVAA